MMVNEGLLLVPIWLQNQLLLTDSRIDSTRLDSALSGDGMEPNPHTEAVGTSTS